ncbi:ATP-binding protein [Maritalea sp.]|uniref:ATP-binding protein n=1 Tax=Maritalea sp. TaxID=2003361 RepID=UPI003EF9A8A2
MTQFIDLVCRNMLTGADSEFSTITDGGVKTKLFDMLETGIVDSKLYYRTELENFVFVAYRKVTFVDGEGKTRSAIYQDHQIDVIVKDIFEFLTRQTLEFIDYAHDIQYLIGALNGISVTRHYEKDNAPVLEQKLEEVNLVSILISAKSAFFRYLTEDTDKLRKEEVSITGKVFKISKGVKFLGKSKGKVATADFNSNSQSFVLMVNIFEFIPYILVENAIKYGPMDVEIDFDIKETVDAINVEISSLGPQLDAGEPISIFGRGIRGRVVSEMGIQGHGMGLYQAQKAAMSLFGGTVSARQNGTPIEINGTPYFDTVFCIRVPRNDVN